jgi:hypothetical protein
MVCSGLSRGKIGKVLELMRSLRVNVALLTRNDYNLSPSGYVATNEQEGVLSLEEAVMLLREAKEERARVDRVLQQMLRVLGVKDLGGRT